MIERRRADCIAHRAELRFWQLLARGLTKPPVLIFRPQKALCTLVIGRIDEKYGSTAEKGLSTEMQGYR